MAYKNLDYLKLVTLCEQIFVAHGFTQEESQEITNVLTMADLYGIESHGVQRLIRYHKDTNLGLVNPKAKPEVVFETPISAVIDAHDAMGQIVSCDAMRLAMKKAKEVGIGMVTVRNSNHYGIAGYYTRMAAENDLIGVCMTNTESIMVPTYGKKAVLGTNPIAVSMPADPVPFLFDAATTVITRGKLEVYNKKEMPVPTGWILDEKGHDATNAAEVLANIIGRAGGGIVPMGGSSETIGGHKGYGFGMICELFTGIMAGGPTSNHSYSKSGRAETSQCFWAIDYRIFGDKTQIRKNFSTFLEELRNSDKAEGQDRIYIHGEKELESFDEKKIMGIPVNEKTFSEIQMIAKSLSVDYVPYIGEEF